MSDNALGEKLRERRTERSMTLLDLCKASGVDTSYLGRIEQGKRVPTAGILKKIAGPLGFDESELLKLAGYLSPDDTGDRIAKFKEDLKKDIAEVMGKLLAKVDSL